MTRISLEGLEKVMHSWVSGKSCVEMVVALRSSPSKICAVNIEKDTKNGYLDGVCKVYKK